MLNYNNEFEGIIEKNKGKKVLLHVCCAPCASACLERFSQMDVTCFFYNPNIVPVLEKEKRFLELDRLCKIFNIPLINFDNIILSNIKDDKCGYKDFMQGFPLLNSDRERKDSGRCSACINYRLNETAAYAKEHNFDYFCTTLTLSPHKDCKEINRLAGLISMQKGVAYLPSDFKKKGGFLRSTELSKHYNIYRQDYCGCMPNFKS